MPQVQFACGASWASSAAHGYRLFQRILHMDREVHSQYEGPPLPFFALLPKSQSFWFTRIILEPCFVFLAATVLEDIFIVQSTLGAYQIGRASCRERV